jgi:hypothetical protein
MALIAFPHENILILIFTGIVDQADLPAEQNYGGVVAAPIFAEIMGKIRDAQIK